MMLMKLNLSDATAFLIYPPAAFLMERSEKGRKGDKWYYQMLLNSSEKYSRLLYHYTTK